MKLNKKKISALLGVGLIGALTFTPTLNTNALLSVPTNYDWSYRKINVDTSTGYNWAIKNNGGTTVSHVPYYNKSFDGTYYDYIHTGYEIKTGLTIAHTFNNSTTDWTTISSTVSRPSDSADSINALNNFSALQIKITIENDTNNNFLFYLDRSSVGNDNDYAYIYTISNVQIGGLYNAIFVAGTANLNTFLIPSNTEVSISQYGWGDDRFDAWYLQDYGLSSTYSNGYDDAFDIDAYAEGYSDGLNNNPNILLNGFQAMVGILVNFVLMIVNLEVFGVSILGVFSIVVLFTGIVWVLKLIRG
jgi:hypothetical protein